MTMMAWSSSPMRSSATRAKYLRAHTGDGSLQTHSKPLYEVGGSRQQGWEQGGAAVGPTLHLPSCSSQPLSSAEEGIPEDCAPGQDAPVPPHGALPHSPGAQQLAAKHPSTHPTCTGTCQCRPPAPGRSQTATSRAAAAAQSTTSPAHSQAAKLVAGFAGKNVSKHAYNRTVGGACWDCRLPAYPNSGWASLGACPAHLWQQPAANPALVLDVSLECLQPVNPVVVARDHEAGRALV